MAPVAVFSFFGPIILALFLCIKSVTVLIFLLDLDKIYKDIYSFLYFWLQIHTTFAPQRPKNT